MRYLVCVLILLCCDHVRAQSDQDGFRMRLDPAAREALESIERFERKLDEYRMLPPEERWDREARLESQLERLLERAKGTRYENKALYYLASWRMRFANGENVPPLLERIRQSDRPSYKQLAAVLSARHSLMRGRIAEAKQTAVNVTAEIPEFTPLMQLIAFHERIGVPAPRIPAQNLTGGPRDPLTARTEPWLLVCFIDLSEPEQRFQIASLIEELDAPDYRDRLRLVCVSFDGNPLGAMTRLGEIEHGAEVDLLWANPNQDGDAAAWREQWRLPELPTTVLLGPAPTRTIMGIDPQVNQLRQLVGRAKQEKPKPRQRTGWGGFDRQRRWSD
ncbi:MAG: hypothetical protein ACOCZK_04950 [Planctomycetota bacterium]